MADLAEAAAKLAAAEAANRKRAERFGIPFTAPTPFNPLIGVGHTDARRLAAAADRDGQAGGLVSGVNPADPAEKAKAQKRAERFGISAFDYDAERAKAAGLNDEERKYREERRRRAAKFGKPDELDLQVAKAAAVSLQLDPVVDKLADAAAADKPTVRPNALHIRGCGYLPAATRDIYSFFGEFRPSWIEWLNGISLNVIFEDAATATRALETFAERIPAVAGVPPVWEGWRVALKPLRKQKTDKYAAKGTESTVYLRYATAADTKEQAIGSTGPRTHGTYSKRGEYSIVKGRVMDTDSEEDEETGAGSGAGGAADVGGEAEMGSSAGAASASAAPAGEAAADGRKDRGGLGEDAADDGAGLTGKRGRRRYEEETDGRPLDRETAAAVFMEEGGGEGGGTGAQGSSDDWLIVGGGAGGGSGSATGDGDARVRGRGLVKARAIAADALGADAGAGVGDAGNGTAAGLPAVHNASEAPASGPHE